jgi:V/A-type H+-transporting ATPase subunit F
MSRVAVVGPRDAILAFKALGADVFPVAQKPAALAAVEKAAEAGYKLVFLSESLTGGIEKALAELQERIQATITVIPDRESTGASLARVKERVEKAIGVDILFKGEEKA